MNDKEKQAYLKKYSEDKKKGVPFYPDIIFKDTVIALAVFLLLIALAYFVGAPLDARANPADASYTPRPEWYFLFLFQMLKYFPGNLEVIGVVLIPTVAIVLLFLLPFIDKGPRRHFTNRPAVTVVTALAGLVVVFLTVQAVRETPPPAEEVSGDQTAALYAANCAPCHGASISVPTGTNLHDIIAQGKHEGMPAWGSDLSTDQIDALAGFILSPGGSNLFNEYCSECHDVAELVASNPLELKKALDQGLSFEPHTGVPIQDWTEVMESAQRTRLLNFLVAPDGARLFATNCSACHGTSVAYSGSEDELRTLISRGGLHLEMPPWQEKLSSTEIEMLAKYVLDPGSNPGGKQAFDQYCQSCHGKLIPSASNLEQAKQIIATGGAHETMPVWGDVLTPEQLDALVTYSLQAAEGSLIEKGQELFAQSCSPCHGEFGEGGANPTLPGDIIAPISTGEYLKTRDDLTLRSIIAQGQPNFGMSPFGSAYGGPLENEEIDTIVAYIRSWEENPPVEVPPEVAAPTAVSPLLRGAEVYTDLCSQCHGLAGEGGIGPAFADTQFQQGYSDQDIFDAINDGHQPSAMIAWGKFLTTDQINELVVYIRSFSPETPTETPSSAPGGPSFTADVLPVFQSQCALCHGTFGGWDASSYSSVINSGDNAPVILPGDAENSLLAHKLMGTQDEGTLMPPSGKLPDPQIQVVIDWIDAGALDN